MFGEVVWRCFAGECGLTLLNSSLTTQFCTYEEVETWRARMIDYSRSA